MTVAEAVAYALADDVPAPAQPSSRLGSLTVREREVAMLIARGASNRAIAGALVISERTVERHVANIFAKLDLGSRVQIAVLLTESDLATRDG